jgi:hypothetical protein
MGGNSVGKDPIGYVISMYNKEGGCIATWEPTMTHVMMEIDSHPDSHSIAIVKCKYSERLNERYVVKKSINRNDTGISGPRKKLPRSRLKISKTAANWGEIQEREK